MNQDYNCFINSVIKIIRANRTSKSSKAGRQVQFVFKNFKEDGYTEEKFAKLLNSAIKEEILILIGSYNCSRVVIHKVLPVVLKLGNLNSFRWATKTGSKAIFRPIIYVVDDGLPDEITKRKKYYKTTGRKFYHVEPIKNNHWILLNTQKPKTKKY